jgi:hypothetical protein
MLKGVSAFTIASLPRGKLRPVKVAAPATRLLLKKDLRFIVLGLKFIQGQCYYLENSCVNNLNQGLRLPK